MGRRKLDAPDALTLGAWEPDGRGVLRWQSTATPAPPVRDDLHLLVACPTCHAKVDETCRGEGRSDGARPRRTPHLTRLAPRLCRCGCLLPWKRKLCDTCRDEVNRENKRDYMRRIRAARKAA